jgi:delta-aminolevulinic acid dehydratase/porphobilinogen synthase
VSHAAAGADVVAPSAMMDGQVRSIREALAVNGFEQSLLWPILHHSSPRRSTGRSAMRLKIRAVGR